MKSWKRVCYRKETTFREAYDATALDWKEIKVAELDVKRPSDKLEMTYLAIDGELSPTTSTGQVTGKMTFSKAIGTSILLNHPLLVASGLGVISTQSNEASVIATKTSNKILVTAEDFADNEVVYFDFAGDGSEGYSSFYAIKTFTTGTKTSDFLFPINDVDYARIIAGTSKMISAKTITPATVDFSSSYQFAVEYQDGRMEVLRGAGLAMSFDIVKKEKLVLKFDIMSSFIGSEDESEVVYTPITGTIAPETDDGMIYMFLKNSYVYDAVTSAEKSILPFSYDLKVNHALVAEEYLSRIEGFYSKPTITGTIEFKGTPANLKTFNSKNEGNNDNFLFLSQENFAVYAEGARFTNLDLDYNEEFDSIKLNTDVNYSPNKKLRIIFPQ